jgi:hypothetical protein
MSKYWIFDGEDTPQGFPFRALVARIRELACDGACQFLIRRAQGYGAQVCHWDEMLDQAEEVSVSADELERLSSGTEEWFYNLDARCVTPSMTIGFGLHDSSALFLDAPSEIAERITPDFKRVKVQ